MVVTTIAHVLYRGEVVGARSYGEYEGVDHVAIELDGTIWVRITGSRRAAIRSRFTDELSHDDVEANRELWVDSPVAPESTFVWVEDIVKQPDGAFTLQLETTSENDGGEVHLTAVEVASIIR